MFMMGRHQPIEQVVQVNGQCDPIGEVGLPDGEGNGGGDFFGSDERTATLRE